MPTITEDQVTQSVEEEWDRYKTGFIEAAEPV
jgi:hypothetical protein